ncbi:MAG: AraC family transcriptional regulator [Kiritimatiellales bacterium]
MEYKKSVLWTVLGYGEENYPEGKKYWCDNRNIPHKDIIILHYALKGEITFRISGKDHPVQAGDMIICRHGENSSYGKHQLRMQYACKWVALSGAGLIDHCRELKSRHGPVLHFGKDHPISEGLKRLGSLINSKEPADPLVMAAAIHRLIISMFAHAESGFNKNLTPVNSAIHQLATTPLHPWNLKQLAAECGCSREHLSREFTAKYGISPRQHLMEHRTKRALYLLKHTALPLSAVAAQSGFSNTIALARQIQSATGKSPKKVRPVQRVSSPKGKLQGLFDGTQL